MGKKIKCIDGKEHYANYQCYKSPGHMGIQRGIEQKQNGLSKAGFVALRHKETGDILIPDMRNPWLKGVTHRWWDSKDNMMRESGSWNWNTSYKSVRDIIIDSLKQNFRSKPRDYEVILFQLKENQYLWYTYTGGTVSYRGSCPLDREDMDKIEKIVVLTSTFTSSKQETIVEKNAIKQITVKEI